MSTLLLIRHGQARAYEPDSDRLSEMGELQAKRLGEFLLGEGFELDAVCCGSLVRQKRTLELVGSVYREAGKAWPDVEADPRWNEYDAPGVLGTLLPALAARDAAFARLVETFQTEAGGPDRNKHFQRMFEVLMDAWEAGRVAHDAVEPFEAFHARVTAVLRAITSTSGRGTVAIFTSGGPIGTCVQTILDAPRRAALRLNWRVKNASITELVFSHNRISLEYFNSVAHLPRELRSFR